MVFSLNQVVHDLTETRDREVIQLIIFNDSRISIEWLALVAIYRITRNAILLFSLELCCNLQNYRKCNIVIFNGIMIDFHTN